MIALYIIGGIVLLIAILLNCPLRAAISYVDEKLDITVKYLFFTLYPVKEKKIKKAEEEVDKTADDAETDLSTEVLDISEGEAENEASHEEEKPKKLTRAEKKRQKQIEKRRKQHEKEELNEKIELIKMLISSSGKGIKKLISSIRIYDIAIDIDVANEDAYEAALGYGRMNILVYNGITFLRTFFTVSLKHINISCIYNSSDSRYDASCNIHVIPAKVLGAAISIAARFFIKLLRKRINDKKEIKAEQKRQNKPKAA